MNASAEKIPQPAAGEAPAQPVGKPEGLQSLDAYRGAIMLLMASSGLGLTSVADHFPGNAVWKFLAEHFYDWGLFTYHWPLHGLALPNKVLRKVYSGNAQKILKKASR